MSGRTHRLVVAAAAAVGSGALFAQPELELFATTDAQTQLVEQISRLRAEDGPTSERTIGPLRALALLHQEAGDDALAIAVLEQAGYVTRIHRGLDTVDEALLLRLQIRSGKALGLHERVWNLEQEMVTIARQHLDDIRTVPLFRELADDRTDALTLYRAGGFPPEIVLGCYYAAARPRYDDTRGVRTPETRPGIVREPGGCRSGTHAAVITRLAWEILMYYADAIEVIVKNGDYASAELRDLERQAFRLATYRSPYLVLPMVGNAETSGNAPYGEVTHCLDETLDALLASEIVGSCLEPVVHANGVVIANVGGWASLVRSIAYEIRSAAPAAVRANALAELADWHLVVAHRDGRGSEERALSVYERAYRELQDAADAAAAAEEIFAPELPVTLPAVEPNPFAPPAITESSRYIDVAFAVTKYGRGERIEILATSDGATRAERRDLIRLIERTSFRPRMVDGELAEAAPVVFRYYLGL